MHATPVAPSSSPAPHSLAGETIGILAGCGLLIGAFSLTGVVSSLANDLLSIAGNISGKTLCAFGDAAATSEGQLLLLGGATVGAVAAVHNFEGWPARQAVPQR